MPQISTDKTGLNMCATVANKKYNFKKDFKKFPKANKD